MYQFHFACGEIMLTSIGHEMFSHIFFFLFHTNNHRYDFSLKFLKKISFTFIFFVLSYHNQHEDMLSFLPLECYLNNSDILRHDLKTRSLELYELKLMTSILKENFHFLKNNYL